MIETLDDIIERFADHLNIYGAHDERCTWPERPCRACWTSDVADRIRNAVEVERKLNPTSGRPADCLIAEYVRRQLWQFVSIEEWLRGNIGVAQGLPDGKPPQAE